MAKGRAKPFNGYTPGVEAFMHAGPHARACDWPGCTGVGEYRAPKSRDRLDAYNWFCLDHVRLYNAAWNYYAGMSDEEVEAEIRKDTIGRRPTWPFGARAAAFGFTRRRGGDPFGLFEEEPEATEQVPPRQAAHHSAEAEALIVLDLTPPVTVAAVKARYKQLVKRHHPDVNGGNKASEEMFKRINHAYHLLMQCLAP